MYSYRVHPVLANPLAVPIVPSVLLELSFVPKLSLLSRTQNPRVPNVLLHYLVTAVPITRLYLVLKCTQRTVPSLILIFFTFLH